MQRKFHVFVRQHQNDAYTVASLTHPHYATYGHELGQALDELSRVLAGELALGAIAPEDVTYLESLERRSIDVVLRAVQHGRLISLPLRVTVLHRKLFGDQDTHEVWLPRIGERFVIQGADSIAPWAEEVVRGRFHLADVDEVRQHEHDRGERVDELVVTWRNLDGKRLLLARGPQTEAARETIERDEPPEDDAAFGGLGTDLAKSAKLGRTSRCHGRDEVVDQLARVLASRQSALLVGPSGSGKTAIVHELGHRMHAERVPPTLIDRPLVHVTPGRLVAGAIFFGQWQERALSVIAQARSRGAILHLGDLGELVQVTASGAGSGMTLPRLLEPFVEQRELAIVLEASPDALAAAEAIEPAFCARLRRVHVPPLDGAAAFEVLARIARAHGAIHRVRFGDDALQRALDLIARFGDAHALPGSGIALVEQMARRAARRSEPLTADDATATFCAQTGYPRALVDPDAPMDLRAVESFLAERVHGQPEAVRRLVDVVALLKAGLDDPERPIASFLFMEPTGVGKTESALTLAEYLFGDRGRLVRLDMSEYAYPSSALRLVEGRGGEGDLTRPLRQQPFTVVLLDEIEKAAPEVFDVLLQVLGEGRLTDGTGRTVSFRHAIVILTSNLGATNKAPIGLGARSAGPDYLGAARRFFRPELLNRIDHVVPFQPLGPEALRSIARRLIARALEREGLARRQLTVEADESVIELVARVGFDPTLGARPMKRAIEAHVLVPLAKRLARGEGTHGGRVRIRAEAGGLVLDG
jgi:ATP-dependent Clp protease ATP-binding subunit ClpC